MERKEKMIKLREQGLSYQAIAKLYNLTRSRVHQIVSEYNTNKLNYRKAILVRDGYRCQWGEVCNGEDVLIRDLVVHHIDFDNRNNKNSNLITLCKRCHLKFHSQNHIDDDIEKKLQEVSPVKKGDRFERLIAVRFHHKKGFSKFWLFKCDCGKEKVINTESVKSGVTKSCGCLRKEIVSIHGMWGTRTHNVWGNMKSKCLNKNNKSYKNYGGCGITVCRKWLKFENFYKDIGEIPKDKSFHRTNKNKNYCLSNCEII